MKATLALREMVSRCDKSAIKISREIGRGPNYVSSLLSSGSTPSVETFASIARACGAELRLILGNESLLIDGWDMAEESKLG